MRGDHKKVCVVGLGYIGLPTAAKVAESGFGVVGVDIDGDVVRNVNSGHVHIVEPGLEDCVKRAVENGLLRASNSPETADIFIIAVPTPLIADSNLPDTSYVEAAAEAIAPVLKIGDLVILESTSPVGTTSRMAEWLAAARVDLTFPQTHGSNSDIRIAHCPERVMPGRVLEELISNDRVVGGMTLRCSECAVDFYTAFVSGECLISSSCETAEMVKLAENSFRDVNIAFANELSMICSQVGVGVNELIGLANRHPRVNILSPGAGVGGHCIAIDPWFLVSSAPDDAVLIRSSRQTNLRKESWVVSRIIERAITFQRDNGHKPVIACLGLSFKPNIDDLRESPAVRIVESLLAKGLEVLCVEPHIERHETIPTIDLEEALNKADLVVSLVQHDQFKNVVFSDDLNFCSAN